MKQQFKAEIVLLTPGWLLGGTRRHVSSWFNLYDDARDFAIQSVEVNRDRPGYQDADIQFQIIGREVR